MLVTADVRVDTPVKVDSARRGRLEPPDRRRLYRDVGRQPRPRRACSRQTPPKIVGSKSAISDVIGSASSTIVKIEGIVTRIDEFLQKNEDADHQDRRRMSRQFTSALAENTDGVQDFLANVVARCRKPSRSCPTS